MNRKIMHAVYRIMRLDICVASSHVTKPVAVSSYPNMVWSMPNNM